MKNDENQSLYQLKLNLKDRNGAPELRTSNANVKL